MNLCLFFKKIFSNTTVTTKCCRFIHSQHVHKYSHKFEDLNNTRNRNYDLLVEKCFTDKAQVCFIIHPFVKWGPRKNRDTVPDRQLTEAVALISTLSNWRIHSRLIVPVENVDRNTVFGSGTTEKLAQQIRRDQSITVVFINVKSLKNAQISELETIFGVPVLDRYNIVMQILKQNACSQHAKLQVELAEAQYFGARLQYLESKAGGSCDVFLQHRERKLRSAIDKLRGQRELLRSKRKTLDYPVVACIGYTNAGKTSLIKCLTHKAALVPKDQLFATLDVTAHAGFLPSKLQLLYIDTVGFISDVPTDLIECFVATLEDALLADVILHVQDISNEDILYQRKHVNSIIQLLFDKAGAGNVLERLISVGNKADIAIHDKTVIEDDMIVVSTKDMTGIEVLKQRIESLVLQTTKRKIITIRVPNGGNEMRWLFKNATVVEQSEDMSDSDFQFMQIIIKESKIKQFHEYFVRNRKQE